MIGQQIISKIIRSKDEDLLFLVDEKMFIDEDECKIIQGIKAYKQKYNKICNIATINRLFPNFVFVDCDEPNSYLNDELINEYATHILFNASEILTKSAKLNGRATLDQILNTFERLKTKKDKPLESAFSEKFINRVREYMDKPIPNKIISSGFEELDKKIYGFDAEGGELVVVMARSGIGKSWYLLKFLTEAYKTGKNVCFVNTEMTDIQAHFRIDTLLYNISNRDLFLGRTVLPKIKEKSNNFYLTSLKDYNFNLDVQKIEYMITKNKIDLLAIDGISHLADLRKEPKTNLTTTLGHIAQDLMDVSNKTGVPIIVSVQSNREGSKQRSGGTGPELENIRDSDAIAFFASLVLSLDQEYDEENKRTKLNVKIVKNRRGVTNYKFVYNWDIDKGNLELLAEGIPKKQSKKQENMILSTGPIKV